MFNNRKMKQSFLQYLYWKFKVHFLDGYSKKSYSQEGEDLLLLRLFEKKQSGFYVDVGAHHPKRFSNTFLLYKKGWHGINIDAMPGSMKKFKQIRPRDINIECAVSSRTQKLDYYTFKDPALNGFGSTFSTKRLLKAEEEKTEIVKMDGMPLERILDKHLPANQTIDLLSVDVEGHDLEVLKSINMKKYSPEYILVEILNPNLDKLRDEPIFIFLNENNYTFFSKLVYTYLFKRKITSSSL